MLTISVEYSVPAQNTGPCALPDPLNTVDCSGSFRMYYSDEGGNPGDVYVEFPIYVSLTDASNNVGKTTVGPIAFFIPFLAVTALLGVVAVREGWKSESDEPFYSNAFDPERIRSMPSDAISSTKSGFLNGEKLGLLRKIKLGE